MRSQGSMREWNGMDKRDQGYSRRGTGGMSHGIPGHPMAKLDNPRLTGNRYMCLTGTKYMCLCDPLQENRPLSIFYKNAVEACIVCRVENGVRDQIFFLFKILIFIPLAIYGPNFIT